jgi:hypothetical protein
MERTGEARGRITLDLNRYGIAFCTISKAGSSCSSKPSDTEIVMMHVEISLHGTHM